MKKQLFSRGLILEGLRRIRVPGIVLLLVSLLFTCLPALFMGMARTNQNVRLGIVSVEMLAEWLLPILYIAPFVLAHTLFSFLNHRNGSDFYHALPHTRESLFVNFTLAVLIWGAAVVVFPVLAGWALYTAFGAVFVPGAVPFALLTLFSGVLLVTACALLAMSVTGTAFSNFILYGLFLLLPRFMITVYNVVLSSDIQIIDIRHIGGLLNPNLNIPVRLLLGLGGTVFGVNTGSLFTSLPAVLYTVVLALIYGALACLFFHRRRSETAERSAPNRALQHVYRCAIALPFSLVIPVILLSTTHFTWSNEGFAVITVAAVTLLVYYLFELLTTKKPKNLLSATPVLLLVVALDIVFGVTIQSARTLTLNDRPAAGEVTGVALAPYSSEYGSNDYNSLLLQRLTVKDTVVKNALLQVLDENISSIRKNGTLTDYSGKITPYNVTFRLNSGNSLYRKLFLTDSDKASLDAALQSDTAYTAAEIELPPESGVLQVSSGAFTQNQAEQLWQSYRSEYADLSDAQKLAIPSGYYAAAGQNVLSLGGGIHVVGNIGLENYSSYYAITSSLPKTAALFFSLMNQKYLAEVKAALNGDLPSGSLVAIEWYSPDDDFGGAKQQGYVFDSGSAGSANTQKLIALLLPVLGKPVDLNQPFLSVQIQSSKIPTVYVPASDTMLNQIKALNPDK